MVEPTCQIMFAGMLGYNLTTYWITFRADRHQKLSFIVWTPIRYVIVQLCNRRGAALLPRYRNRAKITVLFKYMWTEALKSGIVWT